MQDEKFTKSQMTSNILLNNMEDGNNHQTGYVTSHAVNRYIHTYILVQKLQSGESVDALFYKIHDMIDVDICNSG